MIRCCALASLTAVGLLVAGARAEDRAADDRLVAAVRAAVGQGIGPDRVDSFVGQRATFNTSRERDGLAFQRVNLVADSKAAPALPERPLRWVVYWVRPREARNPRVVGIAYPKKGRPTLFYGQVLPP